ncbi:PTS transporter subunit EIIC, partial [Pantoea sp. SIMBA_133]
VKTNGTTSTIAIPVKKAPQYSLKMERNPGIPPTPIGSTGSTFLWPMLALSNIAQGAAALAMILITRNEKTKGLAGTSAVSAFLGVTEPALFGVNLRFKFPFFAAIIGSAIAGLVITVSGVEATSIGVGG